MLGLDHPFFNPLWRRVAVVAFCLGWAILEVARDELLWAAVFGALGLVAAWQFFIHRGARGDRKQDQR